ncbi:SPOR domain-containing protein [Oceanicaulis alexandrii]|uniref:SPOR domain-containing protein n=1 Tax=Oceanicaulis alexandrii TaxID=153233 RepID=UPI0003B3DF6C|nr:SPOR domain-containing protein [Oceanicaulis alexandrii]
MRLVLIMIATLGLTGCVSMGSPSIEGRARPALELAQLLEETAARHPDRVEAASAEMGALRAALLTPPQTVSMTPQTTTPPMSFASAPDLEDAQSLLYAAHLASYRLLSNAEIGWRQLGVQLPSLSDTEPRVERVQLDQGEFLRLKAGPFDSRSEAQALCAQAEAAGLWCQATHFTGEALPG